MAARTTGDERGAITVHVAVALTGMLAFSALAIDHGVRWVGRAEVQNTVDAAAHAGVLRLMRDGLAKPAARVTAAAEALRVAQANPVWGLTPEAVDVEMSSAATSIEPCGFVPGCVRVDVYLDAADRNGTLRAGGQSLPVFFGPVANITAQGARGTSTARATVVTAVTELAPWAVPDKWVGWTSSGDYHPGDAYEAPSGASPTGFTPAVDEGVQLVLQPRTAPAPSWGAGQFLTIDVVQGTLYQVGQSVSVRAHYSDAFVEDGVATLLGHDPGAHWDAPDGVLQSTAGDLPRIVPLAVFDPRDLLAGGPLTIVNFVGLFVQGTCQDASAGRFTLDPANLLACSPGPPAGRVVGRIVQAPGRFGTSEAVIPEASAFLRAPQLVR